MKRNNAGFQPITVFILFLLVAFLIAPQDILLHPNQQATAQEAAACCGECHQDSCCKLMRQVEVMNACCSMGINSEIATSPKITVEEYVDGIIFHSIPPANMTINHVNAFGIYSPEVLVPPPKQLEL